MTDLPRCGTPEDFIEDGEFQDAIIESVDRGAITIDGVTTVCPEVEGVDPPEVGDRVRIWPRIGLGVRCRGLALRGSVVFYRTEAEVQADDEADIARREAEDKKDYEESGKAEQQKRFEALPLAFQRRVKVRRLNNPAFGWRFEGYELFCCEQAVLFADRAKHVCECSNGDPPEVAAYFEDRKEEEVPPTPELRWLFWWRDLSSPTVRDFERQKAEMPGLSDQHSGNTFGAAFSLAAIWLKHGEKGVVAQHGALAPLVGSDEYGDLTKDQIKELEAE